MKVEDLTAEHLRSIKVREMEKIDLGDNNSEGSEAFLSSQYKKAVLNNEGEIIMCMGGRIDGHTAWVWIIASELIYANPVASLEKIIELEKEAIEMHKVKTLYTFNHPGFPEPIRFLKRIGYSERGTRGFKDGQERIILVKEIA